MWPWIDPNSDEAKIEYQDCAVMNNPEVQLIMGDPAMRMILEQMQTDPQAVQKHLKNPAIMEKTVKLKDIGLISMSTDRYSNLSAQSDLTWQILVLNQLK